MLRTIRNICLLSILAGVCVTTMPKAYAENPATGALLLQLGGCFKLHYHFVEDGTHDYDLPDVFERIEATTQTGYTKIQHWGVQENTLMKHFWEEWKVETDGRWTQRVVDPFGDERYTCTSPFEQNQWRCHVANAPKPLRDTRRHDYDVLDRDNTLQITPKGWIQMELNTKKKTSGQIVAHEVGWIEYLRVEDTQCPRVP